MMLSKDIEEVRFMAEVWRLNDERNQRIKEEERLAKEQNQEVDDAVQE